MKPSKWNNDKKMLKYSILEIVLEDHIDFNNKEMMIKNIIARFLDLALKIQQY